LNQSAGCLLFFFISRIKIRKSTLGCPLFGFIVPLSKAEPDIFYPELIEPGSQPFQKMQICPDLPFLPPVDYWIKADRDSGRTAGNLY